MLPSSCTTARVCYDVYLVKLRLDVSQRCTGNVPEQATEYKEHRNYLLLQIGDAHMATLPDESGRKLADLRARASKLTLKSALKLALTMEEQSIKIYSSAQNRVQKPVSKVFLKELVKEEKKHKNMILEAMRDPKKVKEIGSLETEIPDLKVVDYLMDVPLSPDVGYQQILIYAGKREKATHDFYMELAKKYERKQIGKMFAKLAQEELKHKHRLEREYDEYVLTQN